MSTIDDRQTALVMTIIGHDRPGLVETVAALVTDHGGNWLESRMSRLGGQFAGILRVEVPFDNQDRLNESLRSLGGQGLTIVVQPDHQRTVDPQAQGIVLDLVGQDRPGIVRQIAAVLASYGINVEELETERSSAAMTGEPLFTARAVLSIPPACDMEEVRKKLEKIAEDLIVEITFAEVKERA